MCWVFALATGCHLRAMKMACACDPSGLRARSRNLRELGTQGSVPAGSELFGGLEQAVAFTGMRQVPVEDRTKFLSDHGAGYLAWVFEEYLRVLEIRHIYCAPHHPQTNGKIERFHETLKARMNLLVYTSPDELRRTMQDFIEYYNHRRYHEAIGNVTPADVYYGRREEILRRRAEQKQRTIEQRLRYNLGRWNQKPRVELKLKP